jgi:iron transport multicopper oxidase
MGAGLIIETVEAGMMITIIESPDILQKTVRVPPSQLKLCDQQDIPTSGNCAGQTKNLFDVSDCNITPAEEDWG